MNIKDILVYSNPITFVVGIPLLTGIFLAAIFKDSIKNTTKVVKSLNNDI